MLYRIVDLETTGVEPTDGVCEIGWTDLVIDGDRARISDSKFLLVNPGMPIPPETSAIHHIVDVDVAQAPDFSSACASVFPRGKTEAGGMVLVAHNAKFEQQWCVPEVTGDVPWMCTYKCALRVWPEAPAHNNGTLRYWLNSPYIRREKTMPSHRAGPDTYVTAFTLMALLKAAPVDDLIAWSKEPALLVKCGFGKHRGTPWSEVPKDYLRWVLGQDMDEDVKFTARHYLAGTTKTPEMERLL